MSGLAASSSALRRLCLPSALLLLLAAAAVVRPVQAASPEDPYEGLNRNIFAFNQVVDGAFLRPAAVGYRAVLPGEVRDAVSNVFLNLSEPVNFLNSALQGNGDRAGNALGRFLINTTLGIGGLFDVAGALEEPYRRPYLREDFGQTMAVWGWQDSDYFVIPLFGPSTVRDTGGFVVDFATTPWGFFAPTEVTVPLAAVRAIDLRESVLDQLDDLERSSLDYYASLRSIYLQRREQEIFNGDVPGDGADDDIFEETLSDEPATAP